MSKTKNKNNKAIFILVILVLLAAFLVIASMIKNPESGWKFGRANLAGDELLLNSKWVWQETGFPNGSRIEGPGGDLFVVFFGDDGRLTSTTDCNSLFANFSTYGEILNIGEIASTKIYCGPATLEGEYLSELERAKSFEISGRELKIHLEENTGVMKFAKVN
jgi:heat shock protein HslJ